MRIDFGLVGNRFSITADKYNYILNKVTIAKSGKTKGNERLVSISYHSNIASCIEEATNLVIKESDVTMFDELSELFKCLTIELNEIKKELKINV